MLRLLLLAGLTLLVNPPPAWSQEQAETLRIDDVLFEDYQGFLTSRFTGRAGDRVNASFRVEGFKRLPVESQSGLREVRVRLRYEVESRDPQGTLIVPVETGEIDTILGPRDEEWRPKINWSAVVPPSAPGGSYSIQLKVTDMGGGGALEKTVSFRMQGEAVPSVSGLDVVELEYAPSERGPWSPTRYFTPADRVWARYKVAGFRVSPQNQVWLEQDLSVSDAEGNVITAQANAAIAKEQGFYPPRFLTTIFDLRLEDPHPGEYKLRIDVRDLIGSQSVSIESSFFLRP